MGSYTNGMLHLEQPQGVPETVLSLTLIFGLLANFEERLTYM